MSHDARRVSATILVTSMRGGLAIKSETGGFGGMVGSPIFHHKPPEPANYIDVVQQTQNVTPKYKGVGGWGKRNRDAEAVGGAKVFLCPPAGEAKKSTLGIPFRMEVPVLRPQRLPSKAKKFV
jgi:hypothetical protein